MGFWQTLFRRKKNNGPQAEPELSENERELTDILLDRAQFDMSDDAQRIAYVESCLEQIHEAQQHMDEYQKEYATLNAYLEDIERVENLPGDAKAVVCEEAKAIWSLNADHDTFKKRKLMLKDGTFQKIDQLGEETVDVIQKIKEAEEYQQLVRSDLQKLEAQKQAYMYRKQEAKIGLANYRGMAQICIFAVFACISVLLVLQFGFELEAKIGYILTAAMAAIILTILYLKYQETLHEFDSASGNLNKIILLQNRVKIRYVNNTNLLDFLYLKYDTPNAATLEKEWENYLKEKEIRQHMIRTEENLDYHEQELVRMLRKYNLFDPFVWLRQAQALYEPKEMVEVRHSLIMRRQKIRRQIEYSTQNAQRAQNIIKDLVGDYPQYANEILKMVSDWEEKEGR